MIVGTHIYKVITIMCDIGTINVTFYLLEVPYPHTKKKKVWIWANISRTSFILNMQDRSLRVVKQLKKREITKESLVIFLGRIYIFSSLADICP